MKLRTVLFLIVGILAAATYLRGYRAQQPLPKATLPSGSHYSCPDCNIILISVDSLRADHLGTYGYSRNTSPRIDRFAKDALVFENPISQSSWTSPVHASMMTGLLPNRHGVLFYPDAGRLRPEEVTLAEILKDNGYHTVSYNGGGYLGAELGLAQGFDVYESPTRSFHETIPAAQAWIEQNQASKFFLFLHGYDVHRPYDRYSWNTFYKPKGVYDMQQFCRFESRPREGDELEYIIAQYDAGIAYTDDLLGQFFDFLEARGLMERTVIILTSDHGEELFEHGGCDHLHGLHRELLHVPLILKLPSGPVGRVQEQVAASISLLPTILDLLDFEARLDRSLDLLRVLDTGQPQTPIFSETANLHRRRDAKGQIGAAWMKRAITTPDWKVVGTAYLDAEPSYELFDVVRDVGEHNNLAARSETATASLARQLQLPARLELGRKGLFPQVNSLKPETVEQLGALGYLELGQ